MDNHRSDASVLNLSDRLSNDDQKCCHIDVGNDLSLSDSLVDQHKINEKNFTVSIKVFNEIDSNEAAKFSKEYFIKNQSIENVLLKNEKFQVKDEDEHLLVNQKNTDGHNTNINRMQKIVQDKKISHLGSKLKQIINLTEMLWIYLLLFILLLIVGYYVLLCFSVTNIIGICQLKQQFKQVEDTFTKDNRFTNKSKFNGYSLVTTGVDNRVFTKSLKVKSNIHQNISWDQNGITVAGNNGVGNQTNQLSGPFSIAIDDDQTIYVVDRENHRIMEWKFGATSGKIVAGTSGFGNETNQLNWPTSVIIDKEKNNLIICDFGNRRVVKWPRQNGENGQIIISNIDCFALAMDNNGDLYVSDSKKDEVRRWKKNDIYGTLVAGGNGHGNRLDQLHFPAFIFVDENHSVYVSDWYNSRVMKWLAGTKEGIVVAGGQHFGNDLTQLPCPCGLFVDHLGTIYVVNSYNNRIMRWHKGATQGNIVVGDNGCGSETSQLCSPKGLSFDRYGNLYVADLYNCRIQRFNINQI